MFGCKKNLRCWASSLLLEVLLVLVKQSRTLSNSVTAIKMFTFCACELHIVYSSVCGQTVKVPFAVQSSGSSNKNDSHPVCSCDYSTYGSDHLLHRAISAPISSVGSQQKYDCSMVRFMVTSVNKHKLLHFLQMGRGYSENYDGSSSRGVEL